MGRKSRSGMNSSAPSMSGAGGASNGRGLDDAPITSLMAEAGSDPLMNQDLPMDRNQVKNYFDTIGYEYDDRMLDGATGLSINDLEGWFNDIKRARINATKLPKTGDPFMDKPSNIKEYYMATMASRGDSRSAMNKYWSTTPGKADLAEFMRGEIDAGLTGKEMKSVIDSMKRRR